MPDPGSQPQSGAESQRYWRANLRYVAVLLAIWAVVSLGGGVLFADWLDQFRLGGFKLGFWISQQGAIYCFVALIFVYVWLMNRLERRLGSVAEPPTEERAEEERAGAGE